MWIRREGYASNENKVRGRKREGMKIRREVGMEREREKMTIKVGGRERRREVKDGRK